MIFKKCIAVLAVICMSVSLAACGEEKNKSEIVVPGETTVDATETESETTEQVEDITLNFWYTDAGMTDYFNYAVERYQAEHPNVTIDMKMVASVGYLENINTQSINHSNAVDVYMLHNEDIEKAYLAGLALPYDNTDTVFTSDNYGKSAMRAVTYNGKQVAYPLYFDSAFLIYNKAYVTDPPKTFDDILNFSNTLEYSEGGITDNIEKTFIWPVSDYTFNYEFLSDSFIVGGINGDNREQVDVANETVLLSMGYYQALYDYFAISRDEVDYEYCLDSFSNGKNAFTFAKTAALKRLDEVEGLEYGAACMPDLTELASASALSYTQTLVVNPYTTNIKAARSFVKALTYDYVNVFYYQTGYLPSCKNWTYNSDIIAGVYANYDDSTPMPKMMTLGDYYIELEILLHNIWDQNGDIMELLNNFQNFITTQLN